MRHRGQWILIEGPFRQVSDANSDEITILCPDFYDLGSARFLRGQQSHVLSGDEVRILCENYLSQSPHVPESLGSLAWQEPEKSDFATDLEVIQGKIQKGDIQKAVPVIFARTSQPVSAVHRAQMLLSVVNAPPSLYVYGFWQNGEGVLGATPETLFEYSDGTLKTMALAGTCPKEDATHRESLLQDEKEMHEHLLVLEDIKSVLKPLGEIKTEGPQILELPTLFHLFTKITVDCQAVPSFTSLIESLHPTPALGVAPRSYGYKWMKELPGQEGRARYGAPFAFLSKEEALCLVGIRNIQWNKASSMIGSGCGVVAASDLEREWRELYQKRLSVRKILGLNL